MKKIIIFLFVISGITAALPVHSQQSDYITIRLPHTPVDVSLFPGVYEYFGLADANSSSKKGRHAISLDPDGTLASLTKGKGVDEYVLLSGKMLGKVSIDRILGYYENHLSKELRRLSRCGAYLKKLKSLRKMKSLLKDRARQEAIFVYSVDIIKINKVNKTNKIKK